MKRIHRKVHWEYIYQHQPLNTVSWYQSHPETSLYFITQMKLPKTAKIIDIGGGDSFLVDHLLHLGYVDITVLDIADAAIERAKRRLGNKADRVKWVVTDICEFRPTEQYDCWHDRAAFHFLTDNKEIKQYVETATSSVKHGGLMVIGTFSCQGPAKCSGMDVQQYSEHTMTEVLLPSFEKLSCISVDHKTPFNTLQNFVFCSFRKNNVEC